MKRVLCLAGAVGLATLLTALPAWASVPYAGGAYSQNFDTLDATNTNGVQSGTPWSNDVTLTGWYAMQSLPGSTHAAGRDVGTWNATTNGYRIGNGSGNNGALWDYGTNGTNLITDRALGSVGSGTPGDFVIALVLQNTSGAAMTSFTLTYDGEQWRCGGNTTAHKLLFDYATFASAPANSDLEGDNTGVYTADATLNFTGPIAVAGASLLDGNAAANRVAGITDTVTVSWAAGEYLVLRWYDDDDAGSDHGLALDNLSFSAVPEPTTLGLLAVGALLIARRRRA